MSDTSTSRMELAIMVRNMRSAQQQYFRNRTPEALAIAKRHERQVDDTVADIINRQQNLFVEKLPK